eukprot:Gregarina_sp_Poly_1__2503@NODE_167_length_12139_cov_61_777005_g148_i0_p7_GENE_NODE_167_length_12139_cov_61_777005_g148_i0NODE_167_length_12139_cov_61_777005_g148_i0_p7_ORF_typecomplete_len195_score21_13FANCL_C/PF11793_8/0_026_NODE_167_length_12139_cov_61_777005_g148_i015762160
MAEAQWWMKAAEFALRHRFFETQSEKIQKLLAQDDVPEDTRKQFMTYLEDIPLDPQKKPRVPLLCQLTVGISFESIIQMDFLKNRWRQVRFRETGLYKTYEEKTIDLFSMFCPNFQCAVPMHAICLFRLLNECCELPFVADLVGLYRKNLRMLTLHYGLSQVLKRISSHSIFVLVGVIHTHTCLRICLRTNDFE